MKILAINTATEACSVALWNKGILYAYVEEHTCEHAKHILALVQVILDQSNITLTELDALAFGSGPGSFTGIRIGIGVAQGLALGANLPLIGISTLVTIAQGAWHSTGATKVLTTIDAKMGEVYWAEYVRDEHGIWHGGESETILNPEAVKRRLKQLSGQWTIVGTGWQSWPNIIDEYEAFIQECYVLFPVARDMLPISCHLLASGKTVLVENAKPIYLRNKIV